MGVRAVNFKRHTVYMRKILRMRRIVRVRRAVPVYMCDHTSHLWKETLYGHATFVRESCHHCSDVTLYVETVRHTST